MVNAGNTGVRIAQALGISLPSVQNIKKALGLTRESKKPSPKTKARKQPTKAKSVPKTKKKRTPKKPAASVPLSSSASSEPTQAPGG
jgi:hypothetical protein